MGQFSSFDELPTIVHDGILRSLASPSDVANTIRASSGTLQAYVTGSRSVVLVSAMRNFLSLENQHLMNLVIAAPHYCDHGGAKSAIVDFGESRDDFGRAVCHFLHSFQFGDSRCKDEMRPLTLKTFDSSIRLYASIDSEIRIYALYTLARAQRRVNKLSGPQTLRSLGTEPSKPAPDDRETQRLWRGFLLYELFCIMCGMPLISLHASYGQHQSTWQVVRPTVHSLYNMPEEVREEFYCIWRYVIEQYQLAVNEMWENFRLKVTDMGRRASGKGFSTTQELGTTSAFELKPNEFPGPVTYLLEGPALGASCGIYWAGHMAMLGVPLLQEFLSKDHTARLDFFRATHPFLHDYLIQPRHLLLLTRKDLPDWTRKHFPMYWDQDDHDSATHRLRAVGWIFWENPDRLAAMSLVHGLAANSTYCSSIGIPSHLGYKNQSFYVEKAIQPRGWEPIVRDFGTLTNQDQLDELKRLFRSTGNLKFHEITCIVTASRHQSEAGAWAEAEDSGNRQGRNQGGEEIRSNCFCS